MLAPAFESTGIVGILLAAGQGRRFGGDKRWHPLADGTPMVLRAAANLIAACPESVAVLRPGDDDLAQRLHALGLATVVCADAQHGMGHSLAAAVAATPHAAGWLVALADMPYIAPSSYLAVRHALEHGAPLARPFYQTQPGHPVAFSRHYQSELLSLTGDQGGRPILQTHAQYLQRCPVDDKGVVWDVDVPE